MNNKQKMREDIRKKIASAKGLATTNSQQMTKKLNNLHNAIDKEIEKQK